MKQNVLLAASNLGSHCAPLAFLPSPSTPASRFLISEISRTSLDTSGLVERRDALTHHCTVLVENAGATFLATNEAPPIGGSIGESMDLPEAMVEVLQRSDAIVIDGYGFVGDAGLVRAVLREVRDVVSDGYMQLYLDPQAAGSQLLQRGDEVFREALSLATTLVMNESEARAMTGLSDKSVGEVLPALVVLATAAKVIVVKRGAEGCVVGQKVGEAWAVGSVAGFEVDVVDTTGCGDAWLGGLIAGLAKGMGVLEAAEAGNATGAATAGKLGAGIGGVGGRRKVEELLGELWG